MKTRLFLLVGLLFAAMSVQARTYRLEGKVGDKYPIVMELEEHDNGLFSGRYAYRSTLRRNGDVRCSWLYINPDIDNPYSRWIVSDCKHEQVELWYDVNFNGSRLTARHQIDRAGGLHIERGQTFSININTMGITPTNLFGNSCCVDQLVKQFSLNGIDVPQTDTGVYSRGTWDIKMK